MIHSISNKTNVRIRRTSVQLRAPLTELSCNMCRSIRLPSVIPSQTRTPLPPNMSFLMMLSMDGFHVYSMYKSRIANQTKADLIRKGHSTPLLISSVIACLELQKTTSPPGVKGTYHTGQQSNKPSFGNPYGYGKTRYRMSSSLLHEFRDFSRCRSSARSRL